MKRELERDIARMRAVLNKFNKMPRPDRWYVLSRISKKDDPVLFRQVVREMAEGL